MRLSQAKRKTKRRMKMKKCTSHGKLVSSSFTTVCCCGHFAQCLIFDLLAGLQEKEKKGIFA